MDFFVVDGVGMLKGELEDVFVGFVGDEFDVLDDIIYYNVFNVGVFVFGVFVDQDGVDVIVGGFVFSN